MPDSTPTPAHGRDVAVLLPVKAFRDAKARLAPSLDPAARAVLAREMATRVARAAAPHPVAVVCDDEDVAEWATAAGAEVVWRPGRGLNGAVADGVAHLAEAGVARVVVAHADLPYALDFTPVIGGDPRGATLVPDRHDDGTNVVCIPAAAGFRFSYGPGSFQRHRAEAARLDLTCRILRDDRLGWDVDLPADLEPPAFAPLAALLPDRAPRSA